MNAIVPITTPRGGRGTTSALRGCSTPTASSTSGSSINRSIASCVMPASTRVSPVRITSAMALAGSSAGGRWRSATVLAAAVSAGSWCAAATPVTAPCSFTRYTRQ
ncbi:MAG TPA: hypothetical protein VFS20_30270 [Longimicrobium sp.]|nr:hypothetical protein [Longimicrobium sp.]